MGGVMMFFDRAMYVSTLHIRTAFTDMRTGWQWETYVFDLLEPSPPLSNPP